MQGKFCDDDEARLLILARLAKLLPRLFKVSGEIAQDVRQPYQDRRTVFMLYHRVQNVSDVATFNDSLCTAEVE